MTVLYYSIINVITNLRWRPSILFKFPGEKLAIRNAYLNAIAIIQSNPMIIALYTWYIACAISVTENSSVLTALLWLVNICIYIWWTNKMVLKMIVHAIFFPYIVSGIINNRLLNNKPTFSCFIGMSKTFDWVDGDLLFLRLLQYSVDRKLYRTIKSLYQNNVSCVKWITVILNDLR